MRIPARKITPKDVYLNRRRVAGRRSWRARRAAIRSRRQEPLQHHREDHAATRRHHLQQLLRIRHQQGPARASWRSSFKTSPWTVSVEGAVAKPRKFDLDDILQARRRSKSASTGSAASRAGRWWCPWIGFPLSALHQAGGAHRQGEVRGLRDATTIRKQMPQARYAGIQLPLRGRPAHGRSHAPADAALRGHVRRDAAQAERRAGAPGGAVEVRLQEHQVDREDPLRGEAAAHHLEPLRAAASTASTPT